MRGTDRRAGAPIPHPSVICDCRCRHTFSNAFTEPSDVRVSRIDRPITVFVQYEPGFGSSDT